MKRILFTLTVAGFVFYSLPCLLLAHHNSAPYSPSLKITNVSFDWSSTFITLAPGSDNWPMTWADDGHQYTVWGDGGGFNGTNSDCRASLGFGRVEGNSNNYTGFNVWGCNSGSSWCKGSGSKPSCAAENPATFGGKSYGIVSIDGDLYTWWGHDSKDSGSASFVEFTLPIKSSDHGATWTKATWSWRDTDNIYGPSFLNYGQDYSGVPSHHRDGRGVEYVYSYAPHGSVWASNPLPTKVNLLRVPKDKIMDQAAYDWFAGFDGGGNPTWTKNLSNRQPVFQDNNGILVISATYNIDLQLYLLAYHHGDQGVWGTTNNGHLAIMEGIEPWGGYGAAEPWRTVDYREDFGPSSSNLMARQLVPYFSSKWFSNNGEHFTLVFTDTDHWATVEGDFEIGGVIPPDTTPPSLVSVSAAGADTQVTVVFSETVSQASAETPSNYSIDNAISVLGAVLNPDNRSVTLTSTQLSEGITYTLTVNNIQDRATVPNTIASNSQMTFDFIPAPAGGLVAHWPLDDNAIDQTGVNHGTIFGNENYPTGQVGQALEFNGSNNYVQVPPDSSINNLTQLTYAAWIFPRSVGAQELLSKNGSTKELRLGQNGSSLYLRGCVDASGGPACSNSNAGLLNSLSWTHMAMTYDDTGDRQVHLYINGSEVSYSQQSAAGGSLSDDSSSDLNLGRRSTGDRYFDGLMDEVRIYSRALTQSEIQALMGGGPPDTVPPAPPTDFKVK